MSRPDDTPTNLTGDAMPQISPRRPSRAVKVGAFACAAVAAFLLCVVVQRLIFPHAGEHARVSTVAIGAVILWVIAFLGFYKIERR